MHFLVRIPCIWRLSAPGDIWVSHRHQGHLHLRASSELPARVLGGQPRLARGVGSFLPRGRPQWDCWPPTSSRPIPNCCGFLRSELVDGSQPAGGAATWICTWAEILPQNPG